MVDRKKISIGLFFLFLIVYPFGQLTSWIDVIIPLCALCALFIKSKKPAFLTYFSNYLLIALFSWVISAIFFKTSLVFIGAIYLIRLVSLVYFGVFVRNLIKEKLLSKGLVINSLIVVSFFVSIFGWVQYFLYPDLRPLVEYGWDDHLYRLVGSPLDPGFTGIILVLGLVLVLLNFFEEKKRKWQLLIAFFFTTIAFTYSRASYLALISGLFASWIILHKTKTILLIAGIFILLVAFLPRPAGEGVHLERTRSISARLVNYKDGIDTFKTMPLFGVGYNNICLAKKYILGKSDSLSHSCSGFDSSLLVILVTTGIVGFTSFAYAIIKTTRLVRNDFYGQALAISGISVLTHSLFVNSLFYPWVLSWIMILVALGTRE